MKPTPIRERLDKLGEEKRTYPERARQAARDAKAEDIPITEIAFRLGTTTTTIYTWLKEEKS